MAGYVGTKAVNLSTTAATVGGDADIGGALDVGGAFTSQGIDDNANATAITIDSSENVGIGTDSPSSKLHLNGTGATDAKIELQSGTGVASLDGRYGNLILSSDEDNAVAGSLMAFRVDNSEAMRIDSSGNVGIGTSSPISKLEVNSGDIRINDQTNGATRKIYFDMKNSGGAQTDFSLQANNGNFSFYSESTGSERMRIDAAGRVTKPYQPSFRAYKATAGNVTYGAGNIVSASMTSTNYNVGGHYNTSNGRFTAPIAGRYLFWCALYNNSSLSGRRIRADVNGGVSVWGQNQSSSGSDWTASGIADLSTGDYVHMVSAYSDTVVFHDVNHSIWGGYLIG